MSISHEFNLDRALDEKPLTVKPKRPKRFALKIVSHPCIEEERIALQLPSNCLTTFEIVEDSKTVASPIVAQQTIASFSLEQAKQVVEMLQTEIWRRTQSDEH